MGVSEWRAFSGGGAREDPWGTKDSMDGERQLSGEGLKRAGEAAYCIPGREQRGHEFEMWGLRSQGWAAQLGKPQGDRGASSGPRSKNKAEKNDHSKAWREASVFWGGTLDCAENPCGVGADVSVNTRPLGLSTFRPPAHYSCLGPDTANITDQRPSGVTLGRKKESRSVRLEGWLPSLHRGKSKFTRPAPPPKSHQPPFSTAGQV